METYISESACRGMRPKVLEDITVETRRFLVGKLLSARKDARLLVAPTGFGKTRLAAQYASLVFSFWHVFWMDCQDVRFLRALNDDSLAQLIIQRDEEAALVVFDDVPLLSEDQAQAFARCACALQEAGCEVLACATPACGASFASDGAWNRILDCKGLLVPSSERGNCHHGALPVDADELFLARIPALSWNKDGGAAILVRGFAFDELPAEKVLAGLLLFALGSVDGDALLRAPGELRDCVDWLVGHYPYFRHQEERGVYTTLNCDDDLFRQLLLPLITETVSFFDDEKAATYGQALVNLLAGTGQVPRACQAARILLAPAQRKDWLAEHGLLLALSSCANIMKDTAASVSRLCPRDEEGIMAAVVLAECAQGASLDGPAMWQRCFCADLSLKARCIYGALALRHARTGRVPQRDGEPLRDLMAAAEQQEASSWQTRLLRFGYDLAFHYDAAFASLLGARGEGIAQSDALTWAVCLLWLAEDAPGALSPSKKDVLKAALGELQHSGAPQRVLVGAHRALRILSMGRSASAVPAPDCAEGSIPHLHLNLWGSFSASVGARVFDARSFKRKKSMTLLALLATEIGCDFDRDCLVEALWPQSSLAQARRNLYAVWGDLRQTLCLEDGTCPYLIRTGLSYRLNETLVDCDMQEMESLCCCLRDRSSSLEQWDNALAALMVHFGGEVVPGAPGSARLEYYCDAARAGMLDALMAAAQSLLDRGEPGAALRFARAVLGRAPQREDAYELIMKSQIKLGQRTSALNTYLSCQRQLSNELGVDPSPAVYALYEEALGVMC